MNQYEAMFLFDPTFASSMEVCEAEIRRLIVERGEGEIILCRKWDERRLAYPVQGRKRGVYVLTYFRIAPDKVVALERDAKLSEDVLRVLVLRADGVAEEAMERMFFTRDEGASHDGADRFPNDRPTKKRDVDVATPPVVARVPPEAD